MNIGTIVEAPMLQVKMGRRKLGVIEEYFINNLSPGDTFLFAGRIVTFDGLRDMADPTRRTGRSRATGSSTAPGRASRTASWRRPARAARTP